LVPPAFLFWVCLIDCTNFFSFPKYFPKSFIHSILRTKSSLSSAPCFLASIITTPHSYHFALGDTPGHFSPPLAGAASGGVVVVAPAAVGLRCPWPVKNRFISPVRRDSPLLPPLAGGKDGAPLEPLTKPERPVDDG